MVLHWQVRLECVCVCVCVCVYGACVRARACMEVCGCGCVYKNRNKCQPVDIGVSVNDVLS